MKTNAAQQAFIVSLGVAAGLPAVVALAASQWSLALAAAALGAGWGVAHRLGWRWVAPLALAGQIWVAVNGLWHGLPAVWLVAGIAAALCAWDLDSFAVRLARFEPRPEHARLVRSHLARLLLVNGAGLILGEAALRLRITLGVSLTVGLGLVAFVILTQAARLLGEAS
jgi:hypothetical protein